MKRFSDWEGSGKDLGTFLQVGDQVDQGMYDYLLEVVFPASFGRNHVQCGEPWTHDAQGRALYATIARKGPSLPWTYLGHRTHNDLAF